MGQEPSSHHCLHFLQTIEDPHFGQVDLFRTTEIAHLMKKTFTFIDRDQRYHSSITNLKLMQEIRHSSLVPTHKIIQKQEKHLCIQYDILEAYVEYYNFTLHSIIEAGKKITVQELWYTLHSLADLCVVLEENKIQGVKFNIDNVFVSLSGFPCIYLFDAVEPFSENEESLGLQSLAQMMLDLVEPNEDSKKQLETMKRTDQTIHSFIVKIINKSITAQKLCREIQILINEGQIIPSKTLAVTKFMNQIKKQATIQRSVYQSKQKQKEKQKQKQKPSISSNISVQLPSKFSAMESLQSLQMKKKTNNEKQEIMKRRMQQLFKEKEKGGKENLALTKVGSSLNTSTVTSRQSLNNSQTIKPMRSSILWKKKALELAKKQH